MLGLGDIVIPGIFVALLLRYDQTHNKGSTAYFYRCVPPLRMHICGAGPLQQRTALECRLRMTAGQQPCVRC